MFLLALALLVFAQAAFNLNPLFSPSHPNQIVLLYTLSTLIVLVLLVFGFVLLRNLVKVWVERKQQKPGSKFKTSLVVSLVSLTLIPAVCLFLFAFGLVNRQLDKWFSVPVDEIFSATTDMTIEWQHEHESPGAKSSDSAGSAILSRTWNNCGRPFSVQAFIVLDENGQIVRSAAAAGFAAADVTKPIRAVIRNRDEAFLNADPYWAGIQRGTGAQKNLILAAFFPTPARITDLNAKIAAEREYYIALAQNQSGVPR